MGGIIEREERGDLGLSNPQDAGVALDVEMGSLMEELGQFLGHQKI